MPVTSSFLFPVPPQLTGTSLVYKPGPVSQPSWASVFHVHKNDGSRGSRELQRGSPTFGEFGEAGITHSYEVAIVSWSSSSSSHLVLQPAGVSASSTLSSRMSTSFLCVLTTGPINCQQGRGRCVCVCSGWMWERVGDEREKK